jgi:ammonium transporter, Amt family
MGALDFAGGTAVHICAGATVLAHSVYHRSLPQIEEYLERILGGPSHPARSPTNISNPVAADRKSGSASPGEVGQTGKSDANNVENILLGTLLLWIEWFGFNGGSALGANLRAVSACVSTHLAACAGGVTLCLLRSLSGSAAPGPARDPNTDAHVFRWSIMEFCNGAVVGLSCITPAAGYVPHQISPIFGIIGALFCSQFTPVSEYLDDTHVIVVFHGFGGLIGMLLTGFFARKSVARLDGFTNIQGGGWDGHWLQLGYVVIGFTIHPNSVSYANRLP